MKLLGSTKKDVDQDKDGEDKPKLESVEIVLVNCNLVNNNYQQTSKVLFSFVPQNKQFGELLNISQHLVTMLGTTNTEFSFIEVWFTDQISEPVEIQDNVNLTLIIGLPLLGWDTQQNQNLEKNVKGYGFLSFARKFGDKLMN